MGILKVHSQNIRHTLQSSRGGSNDHGSPVQIITTHEACRSTSNNRRILLTCGSAT